MRLFLLSVAARNDLFAIGRFTPEKWGAQQRNKYLKQLDGAFHMLGSKPEIGQAADHIRAGYRKFHHGSHVIFYRSGTKSKIEIIRILHKSMDVELHI